MDIIDTHQHLIYRGLFGYEWTLSIPPLAEGDFTIETYAELTRGKGVVGSVFMETGVNDNDYKAEARHMAGQIGKQGMLGQVASCRPETNEGFDAWLEECAGLNVSGFRRMLHVMPDELSKNEIFRTNLRKIGAAGLPFDICILARQIPIAVDLLRACDQQAYVLNHCGVPDIAGNDFDTWASGIDELAALPQVSVKLSGIAAYCAPGTVSLDTLRPWVDHVLQRFGSTRIVWGGDWPVVNLGCGLPQWIDLTHQLIAELSADEQAAIMAGNARTVYGV